jgi:[acyl-carrier-protein] S-malonyltransferase
MINKAFFLFPGQGSQYPGMALDLLEGRDRVKRLFTMASEIYGKDMAGFLANASPEDLKPTNVCQPVIILASLAAAACLAEKGVTPCGCAGFSLGEYAAIAIAGVISEQDCFTLVTQRGKAMQAAIDRIPTGASAPGMAAVVGLAPEQVESLIVEWKKSGVTELYAANINSPKQVVVSGNAPALEEAEKRFKEAGAKRIIRLQVAGPYHSPFMKEAADAFAADLEKAAFSDPKIPLFSNVTGKQIKTGAEAKALALRQIVEAVRWTDEEASIAAMGGFDCLLETGPGKVLQGLWKDTGSEVPCREAGTAAEINELVK